MTMGSKAIHVRHGFRNEKTRVGFGRTEVSVHRSKALRELFRMGMVSGVLVFKGVSNLGRPIHPLPAVQTCS